MSSRHKCLPDNDGDGPYTRRENYTNGCMGCMLQIRADKGNPMTTVYAKVEREIRPVEMVEAGADRKIHNRRKNRNATISYHRRIQKKWDKRWSGTTVLKPKTEQIWFAISGVVARYIRSAQLNGYIPCNPQ